MALIFRSFLPRVDITQRPSCAAWRRPNCCSLWSLLLRSTACSASPGLVARSQPRRGFWWRLGGGGFCGGLDKEKKGGEGCRKQGNREKNLKPIPPYVF